MRPLILLLFAAFFTLHSPIILAKTEYEKGLEAYKNEDYDDARDHWEEAANDGNLNAAYNLGILYSKGLGGPKDASKAVALFKPTAEAGLASAQHNLALAYYFGKGIKQDFERAKIWWTRAAHQDHAQAQFNLATLLWNGNGTTQNPDQDKALKWFRKAEKAGHKKAAAFLTKAFSPSLANSAEAASEQANQNTNKGEASSSKELDQTLQLARQAQTQKDYANAFKHWSVAAEQNSAEAQYQLAQLYEKGLGVEANPERAFNLINDSAKSGQPQAQFALGQYYVEGTQVPQNKTLALYWIQSAADQNHLQAKDYLDQLR